MLILIPFSALIVGLSAAFVVTSAPSGSTIVFVVQVHNIYSSTVLPSARMVVRVLS